MVVVVFVVTRGSSDRDGFRAVRTTLPNGHKSTKVLTVVIPTGSQILSQPTLSAAAPTAAAITPSGPA